MSEIWKTVVVCMVSWEHTNSSQFYVYESWEALRASFPGHFNGDEGFRYREETNEMGDRIRAWMEVVRS